MRLVSSKMSTTVNAVLPMKRVGWVRSAPGRAAVDDPITATDWWCASWNGT